MEDRIAKQRLNVILLIDVSKSMQGKRIKQVNDSIIDIRNYLIDLEKENPLMDFYITLIPFSSESYFYDDKRMINVNNFTYNGLITGGWSNLHLAYQNLGEILLKESKGGIMPDFGGAAPIILLLTDGHPTSTKYKDSLKEISNTPWFKASLRYGIAIELDDDKTIDVLKEFVGNNGDVIKCMDSSTLKNIIKIIVLTASKVKSTNSNIVLDPNITKNKEMQQLIADALTDEDSWEW